MLKQYHVINITGTTISEGSAFMQNKEGNKSESKDGSDKDNKTGLHPKWKDCKCSICDKKRHPPYAKYCKAVRAIAKDANLQSQIKKTYTSSSKESEASFEKSKSHKSLKKKKKDSKKALKKSLTNPRPSSP